MGLQEISIRRFCESDIPFKVRWINDERNNQFLHYDLPLTLDSTMRWFRRSSKDNQRADYTILYGNTPVGIIGLLQIDSSLRNAEYYITLGEVELRGKGIAEEASRLLFDLARDEFKLKSLYLYTEQKNFRAQKFFEKIGFRMISRDVMTKKRIDKIESRLFYSLNM